MADGTVTIDLNLNKDSIMSDVDTITDALKGIGANVDASIIEDKFNEALNAIENKTDETVDDIDSKKATVNINANDDNVEGKVDQVKSLLASLPEDKKTALIAELHNAGFDDFKELLDSVPAEKQTELLAAIEAGNIDDFKTLLASVPHEKTTELKANDEDTKEKVEQLETLLKSLPKEKATDLVAKLHDSGFNNFKELLDSLPKEKQTELLADIKDGNVIKFDDLIKNIPTHKTTELKANDTNLIEKADDSKAKIDEIPDKKTTELTAHETVSPEVDKITASEDRATEHTNTLKDVIMGTFVGNAIQGGISAITTGIKNMTQAGEEYNEQQDTMKINWENLTREAPQDGKNMINMINSFSQSSIYSADTLDHMAQSFYHVDSNAKQTRKWTQDFIDLGSTLHVSNDALAESAEMFAKVEAGGKATSMDIQMMINRFPMFGEALEKATGKSMTQLRELSAKGKLTAQTFSQALDYLGQKYSKSQAEAMTSFRGMTMHLKSQFDVLSGDVMASSFKMSKSTLSAIQKITDDKSMQTYANAISGAFATVMTGVSKVIMYISSHSSVIMNLIHNIATIVGTFGSAVWNTIKGIVSDIAGAFERLSGNAKKSQDPLTNVSNALGDLAKHQEAIKIIASTLLGLFASKKIFSFAKGLTDFVDKAEKATAGLKGLKAIIALLGGPISAAVTAIAALTVAFVGLYKNDPKFKAFIDNLVKHLQDFCSGLAKYFSEPLKGITKVVEAIAAPVEKAFSKMFATITPTLKKIGSTISDTFKNASDDANKAIQTIGKVVATVWNNIKGIVIPAMKTISSVIDNGVKVISTVWKSTWNLIADVFKLVWDIIFDKSKVMNDIKKLISDAVKAIQNIWNTTWNAIKDVFSTIWNGIKSIAGSAAKWVENTINSTIKSIQSTWNSIWQAISDFFNNIWESIKKICNDAINFVKTTISNTIQAIQNTWNSIWQAICNFIKPIWEDIKSTANNAINWVHDTISSVLNRISDTWHSIWNDLSSFFEGIWKNIKGFAADGINGVIHVINAGVDGIDTVWKFFTGHETSIHHLKPVHFEQGGIVDRHLSMVNDGAGPDWKELIETPDGQLLMSNERNAVLPLEPGTRVYNGTETKAIMNMAGIEHYAKGGVVGDVIDWGSHELKDIGSWIKDKWDTITKFLKHPIENTKAIINKAIDGPIAKLTNSNMADLARGVFNKLTQPISDWFKKGLQKAKDEHDAESAGSVVAKNIGAHTGSWAGDIRKIADEMHVSVSDSDMQALLARIQKESGGDQSIRQQVWDVNMANGDPAQGLFQYIPPTFAYWAVPGHNNILSGDDQIRAVFNDSNWRSDIRMPGGWGPTGHRVFGDGGHVLQPEYALIGEDGDEFVVNPKKNSADALLMQAAQERLNYDRNSIIANAIVSMKSAEASANSVPNTSITSVANNRINSNFNKDLDTLIDLVKKVKKNSDKPSTIKVPLAIDGKKFAEATAKYTAQAQANYQNNQNFLRGMRPSVN